MKISPFEKVHKQLGASFAEYDGWLLPKEYSNGLRAEQEALSSGCAAFDLCSFARITIHGPGSENTVAGVLGQESLVPGPEKWVSADGLRVVRGKKGFVVLTMPNAREEYLDILQKSADPETSVTDITESTAMLGIYGPQSYEKVCEILPFDLSQMTENSVKSMSLFMINVTILRGSWINGDGVELICPVSAAPFAASALTKYKDKKAITPAGMDCLVSAMARSSEK